jgi:hypothetical protein
LRMHDIDSKVVVLTTHGDRDAHPQGGSSAFVKFGTAQAANQGMRYACHAGMPKASSASTNFTNRLLRPLFRPAAKPPPLSGGGARISHCGR